MVELHHLVISTVSMFLGAAGTLLSPWHGRGGVSEREAFELGRDSMLPFD